MACLHSRTLTDRVAVDSQLEFAPFDQQLTGWPLMVSDNPESPANLKDHEVRWKHTVKAQTKGCMHFVFIWAQNASTAGKKVGITVENRTATGRLSIARTWSESGLVGESVDKWAQMGLRLGCAMLGFTWDEVHYLPTQKTFADPGERMLINEYAWTPVQGTAGLLGVQAAFYMQYSGTEPGASYVVRVVYGSSSSDLTRYFDDPNGQVGADGSPMAVLEGGDPRGGWDHQIVGVTMRYVIDGNTPPTNSGLRRTGSCPNSGLTSQRIAFRTMPITAYARTGARLEPLGQ